MFETMGVQGGQLTVGTKLLILIRVYGTSGNSTSQPLVCHDN